MVDANGTVGGDVPRGGATSVAEVVQDRVTFWNAFAGDVTALTLTIGTLVSALASAWLNFGSVFGAWSPWVALGIFGIGVGVASIYLWPRVREAYFRSIIPMPAIVPGPRGNRFDLSPWTEADSANFVRDDHADSQFIAWLKVREEPLLYVLGDSGVGKSSLLYAGVFPVLKTSGWDVVSLRPYDSPAETVRAELLRLLDKAEVAPAVADRKLLEELAAISVAEKRQLLLVLDQFEEALILPDAPSLNRLGELLRDHCHDPIPGLVVLISMRSDYVADLRSLPINMPALLKNWFQVMPFTFSAATSYLQRVDPNLSATAIRTILKQAAEVDGDPTRFRPIVINMFGLVVASQSGGPSTTHVPRRILSEYVRASMLRTRLPDAARGVVRDLLTESGTKRPRRLIDLVHATGRDAHDVAGILGQLAQDGLARPLDDAGERWEVSHDFVARIMAPLVEPPLPTLSVLLRPWLPPVALVLWVAVIVAAFFAYMPWQQAIIRNELATTGWTEMEPEDKSETGTVMMYGGKAVDLEDLARAGQLMARLVPPVTRIATEDDSDTAIFEAFPPVPSTVVEFDAGDNASYIVNSLKGMPDMPALKVMRLVGSSDRGLTDFEGFASVPSLETLQATGNLIESLKGLPATMNNLEWLDVSANERLRTLEGLPAELPRLKVLDASGTKLTDLTGLHATPALEKLLLSGSPVSSLEALPEIETLTELDLSGTDISSLKILARLPNLEQLSLDGLSNVTDLRELPVLPRLSRLSVQHGGLTSLDGIEEFANLKELSLRSAPITSLDLLPTQSPLERLDIEDIDLESPFDLARLLRFATTLSQLDLGNTPIVGNDYSGLAALGGLKRLDLWGATITDVTPISALRALEFLDLRDVPADIDLSPLREIAYPAGQLKCLVVDAEVSDKAPFVIPDQCEDDEEDTDGRWFG